jgi:hypothetical protein
MGLILRIPKGSRLTWSELDGDFLYLSSSIVELSASFASALQQGGGTLQNSLTSNQTVGGIHSGDTFAAGSTIEALLNTMLVSYIKPSFATFAVKNGGTTITTAPREVGEFFLVNTASFASSADSPTGLRAYNVSITSSGATSNFQELLVAGQASAGTNTVALGSSYTMTTAGTSATNITFLLKGTNSVGVAISTSTITVPFQYKNYLAASTTVLTNASSNAAVQTVALSETVTSQLDTGKAWDPVCTAANADQTKYTYIIYPSSYGTISSIKQNGSQDVTSAFTLLRPSPTTAFSIQNASGGTLSVFVYKSNQPGAFRESTELYIT